MKRNWLIYGTVVMAMSVGPSLVMAADAKSEAGWKTLPLIKDGKVDPAWVHVGYGGFVVDDGALRTECDPKGLGLLVYSKERLGNCQLRVVFKTKDERANAGVYVRIADGILEQVGKPGAAFDRDAKGAPSPASMEKMKASAEREEGPWFAVHRGYEVQIAGEGTRFIARARFTRSRRLRPRRRSGEWQTMLITLDGTKILVDLDGQRITSLDTAAPNLPEPKREPKRPHAGYIGLQNHDPGDVVWFKEVSVKPLAGPK